MCGGAILSDIIPPPRRATGGNVWRADKKRRARPDAAAGGFPARGAPGAATEPPSLAQYISLDQFPVGEHRHSRAAELRRALADSAEQPLAALATICVVSASSIARTPQPTAGEPL